MSFAIEGLLPGEYFLRAIGGGTLKSVRWEEKDYTFTPFDTATDRDIAGIVVTYTNQTARITGAVRGAQGGLVSNAAVIYFPVEREQWSRYGAQPSRLSSVVVNRAGQFGVERIPAGEYMLIAVEDDLLAAWKDPAFLEAVSPLATRIRVDWGETQVQGLRVQQVTR